MDMLIVLIQSFYFLVIWWWFEFGWVLWWLWEVVVASFVGGLLYVLVCGFSCVGCWILVCVLLVVVGFS